MCTIFEDPEDFLEDLFLQLPHIQIVVDYLRIAGILGKFLILLLWSLLLWKTRTMIRFYVWAFVQLSLIFSGAFAMFAWIYASIMLLVIFVEGFVWINT
ncbi:hypothetical protein B0J14DRAFT_37447 [Halenospora varia]|nr:hypothetical protein B0J14DRAFT_37447 [Halenospora varia]